MGQTLPAGACDCHTHVVGDATTYPMVPERQYTPAPAGHEALLEHLKRVGLQRVVLVQPSFYGNNNRCMLDSLARLQGMGRGVAVVSEDATDDALGTLHAAGVRGLRINVESAGMRDAEVVRAKLQRWAERLAPWGWHVQLYAAHSTIAALAPVLVRLPVPTVIDHFAMISASASLDDPSTRSIIDLVSAGSVYIKLSAPYRIAHAQPISAALSLADAYLQAHPGRVLWGSDWPHTNREPGKQAHEVSRYRSMEEDFLISSITRWLSNTALRQQVLVENPVHLYDF